MRRVIHQHIATHCIIRQPHLSPVQPTSLEPLPLQTYSAVTRLDLSQCLDWIQHPSLKSLADLATLVRMPQLKEVDLRPLLDHIDSAKSFRIKSVTDVLCWADDVVFRIWDRWKLAPNAAVSSLINVPALADLPNLESIRTPDHPPASGGHPGAAAHRTAVESSHPAHPRPRHCRPEHPLSAAVRQLASQPVAGQVREASWRTAALRGCSGRQWRGRG